MACFSRVYVVNVYCIMVCFGRVRFMLAYVVMVYSIMLYVAMVHVNMSYVIMVCCFGAV